MTSPIVRGLLETSIYVGNLQDSQAFYERVLGCVEIMREPGRLHALKIAGNQVLLIFALGKSLNPTDTPGGRIPSHNGHGQLHLAFEIDQNDIQVWRAHLQQAGVTIESEVTCARGGYSIYFRDPDQHLVELVTRRCWDFEASQ